VEFAFVSFRIRPWSAACAHPPRTRPPDPPSQTPVAPPPRVSRASSHQAHWAHLDHELARRRILPVAVLLHLTTQSASRCDASPAAGRCAPTAARAPATPACHPPGTWPWHTRTPSRQSASRCTQPEPCAPRPRLHRGLPRGVRPAQEQGGSGRTGRELAQQIKGHQRLVHPSLSASRQTHDAQMHGVPARRSDRSAWPCAWS
jgi:hypothetical protein